MAGEGTTWGIAFSMKLRTFALELRSGTGARWLRETRHEILVSSAEEREALACWLLAQHTSGVIRDRAKSSCIMQ